MGQFNFSVSKIAVAIFFITSLVLKISDISFSDVKNYGSIDWDNFGYYLYLPATFIYDDLKLQDDEKIKAVQKKYELSSSYYQAHSIHNGNRVIQYTSGMAIIYSPAFFVAHAYANVSSAYPADGFSAPYQISVLIESFILLFIGLFFLRKFCLFYFNDRITALIVLIICFGTNFFQIASVNISSPHAILFTAYTALLYLIHRWHQMPKFKTLMGIAFILALMVLSRPNELIFLLIPILWIGGQFPNIKSKVNYFLEHHPLQLVAFALPFALFGALQPLYWHYTTGEWIFDSYIYEDFKLLNPYLSEYLFSFKKGWFLYTPIMVFAILGFIPFYKRNKSMALNFFLFTVVNIWILSSWDCWWYADSFSQRSIVQSYPIFALPLGYLLQSARTSKNYYKYGLMVFISLAIILNLYQTYQFKNEVIHGSRMSEPYYKAAFFDLTPDPDKQKLLEHDPSLNYVPKYEELKSFILYKNSYENLNNGIDSSKMPKINSEGSLLLTKDAPFSEAFRFPFDKYCDSSYAYFIVKARYRSFFPAGENPFGIVGTIKDYKSKKKYKYLFKSIEQVDWFEVGSWSSFEMVFVTPHLRSKNDSLSFYLYLIGDHEVEIDQFYVKMLEPASQPKLKNIEYYNDYHTITNGNWTEPKRFAFDKSYELIDSSNAFSSTLKFAADEFVGSTAVFELSGFATDKKNAEVYAVVSSKNKAENSFYTSKRIDNAKEWEKQSFKFNIPNSLSKNDTLLAYIWSKSTPYLIRSINIKEEH